MKKFILVIILIVLSCHGCSKQGGEELIQEYIKKAESLYEAKDYIGAVGWMDHAIDEAEKKYGEISVEVAELYLSKFQMADYAIDSLRAIRSAEMIYEDLSDREGMVKVYYYYGDYYSKVDDLEQAVDYYEKVIELSEGLGEAVNEWKYEAYFYEALYENDTEKSIELYEKAESLLEFVPLEKKNTETIVLYHNIAVCYYDLQMYEKAILNFTKAIENYEEEEKEIGTLIVCYRLRAVCYIGIRNLEYAMEDTEKAKELLERTSPKMNIWDKSGVYFNFTMIYPLMDEPDYEKAFEYGLIACRMYENERELSVDDLEGLIIMKDIFKDFYDESPYAQEQNFEIWYQENINK